MTPFTFYSLIPELKKEGGHLLAYHTRIQEVIESLGGKFFAYVNQQCNIALKQNWLRWFRRRRDIGYTLRYHFRLFNDYRRLFSTKQEGRRIFFIDAFDSVDLIPLVFASIFFAKTTDEIWMLSRFLREPGSMRLQSILIRLARAVLKKRLNILSDSELLAPHLESLFKQKVHLLPHYVVPHFLPKKPAEKITCAWLGGARLEKGLLHIEKLLKTDDPMREKFTLALPESLKTAPSLNIRKVKEGLPQSMYEMEFSLCDVVFLPYLPHYYRFRTSGIFIEAITAGKVPLVKEGTYIAHKLREYNLDELIVDWDNPLFFSHLATLLKQPSLSIKLKRMQHDFQELHSFPKFQESLSSLLKK